jgi:hypothetical protein
MWAYAVACFSGLLFAAVLSLLVEKGDDHPGRRFTWWAVMQRPVPVHASPAGDVALRSQE